MFDFRSLLSFLTLVPALHVAAQDRDVGNVPEPTLDVPGDVTRMLQSASSFDLKGTEVAGNPMNSVSSGWPEDLVIAPIPGRSPQLGWMLTLAGGYFIGKDETDPDNKPSIIGGFAMYAENGSYAYGGGANLHLLDDRLRVKTGVAYLDVEYTYYGTGNYLNKQGIGVNVLQEGPLYFAESTWRVWNKLYLGVGYLGGTVDSRARVDFPQDSFFEPVLELGLGGWTLPVQYDSRDSETYPRKGWLIDGRAINYRESLGSDFEAETVKIAVNHYRTFRQRDVLALRFMARSTYGNAPFFLQSTFGGKTDLRGYPSGRFRDRMMYAGQAEYRWQVSNRWVVTGFAGVGEVAESFHDIGENFLPAAGVGLRFFLSQKHEVGLSTDIAVGKEGWEFYFGVGEAF